MNRISLFLFANILSLCVLWGCGGSEADQPECDSDTVDTCSCADDSNGKQICTDGSWGECVCEAVDSDDDGIVDDADNCPEDPNPGQADFNSDGAGDVCEDSDGDGVSDNEDNCPEASNATQGDFDGDGTGDACDGDVDGDEVEDSIDNCPRVPNADQTDTNSDGLGDGCDGDSDGVLDSEDNCPDDENPDQSNIDMDARGDVCDRDIDDDGVINVAPDNCPESENPDQLDTDSDSVGDACDEDDDNDEIDDTADNCPLVFNPGQADLQMNGVGDECEDSDMDGVLDATDNCPYEPNPDQAVIDSDDDTIADCHERADGTDPLEADTDNDGLDDGEESRLGTDPLDPDSDGDGVFDGDEVGWGLDPTNPISFNDGVRDGMRPYAQICNSTPPSAPTVLTLSNNQGEYSVPTDFDDNVSLNIVGATPTNGWAATTFTDTTSGTTGFVLVFEDASVNSILLDAAGLDNPQKHVDRSNITVYRQRMMSFTTSPDETRNNLLLNVAPFTQADVANLPAAGTTSSGSLGHVSVRIDGAKKVVVAVFSSSNDYETNRPLLDHVSDLSGFFAGAPSTSNGCETFVALDPKPVELYWVVKGQAGSLWDELLELQPAIPSFVNRLTTGGADYRFGITTMNSSTDGQLRSPPGWHTLATDFTSEIDYIINCGLPCYGRYGLESAENGIRRFLSTAGPQKTRANAEILTVFVSDSLDATLAGLSFAADLNQTISSYGRFFEPAAYGLIRDCDLNSDPAKNTGYRRVIDASGGFLGDLCIADSIPRFLRHLADEAIAIGSVYELNEIPVASTIRVFVGTTEVDPDDANGWFYDARHNTIAFVGSAQPVTGASADRVTILFETTR